MDLFSFLCFGEENGFCFHFCVSLATFGLILPLAWCVISLVEYVLSELKDLGNFSLELYVFFLPLFSTFFFFHSWYLSIFREELVRIYWYSAGNQRILYFTLPRTVALKFASYWVFHCFFRWKIHEHVYIVFWWF